MLKSRLTLLYFGAAIVAGIFVACSGNANDKKALEEVLAESGDDITPREQQYFKLGSESPYTKSVIAAYQKVKKAAKHLDFFCNTGSEFLFLATKNSEYDFPYDPNGQLFGLIDQDGNTLLPVEYEKIGNPGMLAKDYLEIRKGGKYGLYNYVERKLIAAKYEVIFPSSIMGYVAIGQRNKKLCRIYKDGSEKPFADDMPVPDYARLISKFKMDGEKPSFAFWLSTAPMKTNDYDLFFSGNALVQMPSYIDNLKIMPLMTVNLDMPWSELSLEDMKIEMQEEHKHKGEITSYLINFLHRVGEARPEEFNQRNLVTVDKRNRVKSRTELLKWTDRALQDYWDESDKFVAPMNVRFINDSVVEASDFAGYEGDAVPYSQYTKLSYFTIHKDGSVSKPAKGLFPMTSDIELKPEHFKGRFIRYLREDEVETAVVPEEWEDYGYSSLFAVTKHLSAADLEYMEMEIYARHGLKFSDVRWKGVFSNVKWYKPQVSFEKVQKLLTSIEKKNIALMQKLRKQIDANPGIYLQVQIKPHVEAG